MMPGGPYALLLVLPLTGPYLIVTLAFGFDVAPTTRLLPAVARKPPPLKPVALSYNELLDARTLAPTLELMAMLLLLNIESSTFSVPLVAVAPTLVAPMKREPTTV